MLTCLHQPTPTSELSVGNKVSKSVKSGHISGCRTSGEVARGSKLNAAGICFETLATFRCWVPRRFQPLQFTTAY